MVNLTNTSNQDEQSIVAKILGVLWQRIIIVIIAIVISLIAFFAYFKLKKPDYTAYENVLFTVKNVLEKDDNSTTHIDSARKYASTVSSFFSMGYVVDRANFYYDQFNKMMIEKGITDSYTRSIELQKYIYSINGINITDRILEEYKAKPNNTNNAVSFNVIKNGKNSEDKVHYLRKEKSFYIFEKDGKELKINQSEIEKIILTPVLDVYNPDKEYDCPKSIIRSNIDVTYDEQRDNYCFTLSYVDNTNTGAEEKVRFVALAADQEAKRKNPDNESEYVYFYSLKVDLTDIGAVGHAVMNVSRKKTLIIFVIVGAAVGIIAVYLSTLMDKSITSRKEIEVLTGVPLLAHIESVRDGEK